MGIPIVGRDATFLLDRRSETERTHSAEGIGDAIVGSEFVLEEVRSFSLETGAPIDFGEIEIEGSSVFYDVDGVILLAGEQIEVVGSIGSVDLTAFVDHGADGGMISIEEDGSDEFSVG